MKPVVPILIAAVFCAPASAQNWPSFRGPLASGVSDGAHPPVSWSAKASENISWKTPIAGLAHASPIVWGDLVFVTTAISSDPKPVFRHGLYGDVTPADDQSKHSWRVYALDRKTGKVLWERIAHEGVPKIKRHPKSTHASSTPVTDGRHVVALFGSEGLFCYDFDGKLLWKKDLGVLDAGWFYDPDYQWGTGSSPIIYRDLVIVQCDRQRDSFIAAFDVRDGKERWRARRGELPSWATPAVFESGGRAELVTNATRRIQGYDPSTGEELWWLSGNSEIVVPTPIFAQGLIFVTSGYSPIQPIYAIRPGATGDISLKEGESSNQFIAWSTKRGGPYLPTPIAYGEYLYTCSNNGVLACYRASTGERIYQQRIGGTGGAFTASPVTAGGNLYFASEDGDVFVVRAGPTYELVATNPMGEVCMATPAISDGMIFIRTQYHVFAIGKPDRAASVSERAHAESAAGSRQ